MTQKQLDKVKCIFTTLILLTSCTSEAHLNQINKKETLITIDSLVNRETLGCSFNSSSESLVNFYNTLLNQSTRQVGQTSFNIGSSYHITGIKKISNIYNKDLNETSKNMDVDFKKFGVRVLRISSFTKNGDGENFGYYIVLKNKPSFNKNVLRKHNIALTYSTIEETTGGNTRVRCILVG